ncbi:MAG: c-type cytochrome [Gemmatimonadaceae bacterium]
MTVAALMLAAPLWSVARAQGPGGSASRQPGRYAVQTNDDLQPTTLPPMPVGMTIATLVQGDQIFHGKGGCFACHGTEGQGLPAAGDALTTSLAYARYEWKSIDSLVTAGMPDAQTRSPIAMPARGARGDLTREEIARVAAYVWAISQVRGEPWPGGHASHQGMVPAGSTSGTAQAKPWTTLGSAATHPERNRGKSSGQRPTATGIH